MNQAKYYIKVLNWSGVPVFITDDIKSLIIEHTVNSYSTGTLVLDARYYSESIFKPDHIIQVFRKVETSPWYVEATLFHRTGQRDMTDKGDRIFTSYSRGLLDLINRRNILFYATTAYTLKQGPAETVIKEFVTENIQNTTNRIRSGTILGLSVEADGGRGVTWAGQRSWRNLLEIIQEIASASNVDFDVVPLTNSTFEFRCYYPHRGTDRTSQFTFSPEFGTMLGPTYTLSRTEEATIVVVLGSEQGTNRRTLVVESTDKNDSPWNDIEVVHDDRQDDEYQKLLSAGNAQLKKVGKQENFTFQVVQTDSGRYGRDYFLGDLVTARFDDIVREKKIISAKIHLAEGKEDISLDFANVPEVT